MSKNEILTALPQLTAAERQEIRLCLAELDHSEWLDDGELTDAEKSLIDTRLDTCERATFVPWEDAKSRIAASLKR